ncbi:MAG: molybdopterin converting factor subunit 1 [Pseudomonadota bacterium]
MKVRVLYFARLRETFGTGQETLELAEPATLVELLQALRARGGAWSEELAPGRAFRLAVNQEVAAAETPLAVDDEVAIFPPVTGG